MGLGDRDTESIHFFLTRREVYRMAWRLSGQLIETCSCNMFCPCWFTVQELMVMDKLWCASAITYRVREGNADGVDLGGRTFVFAVDFPGPTRLDVNGTALLYVDEEASA